MVSGTRRTATDDRSHHWNPISHTPTILNCINISPHMMFNCWVNSCDKLTIVSILASLRGSILMVNEQLYRYLPAWYKLSRTLVLICLGRRICFPLLQYPIDVSSWWWIPSASNPITMSSWWYNTSVLIISCCVFSGVRIWGYEDTRIRGYEDMRIWGYEDLRIWGHSDTAASCRCNFCLGAFLAYIQ